MRPLAHLTLAALVVSLACAGSAQETPEEEPAGHYEEGTFVPADSTLEEVRQQQAANRAQADILRQQEDEEAARRAEYDRAQEAYHAEVARIDEETRAMEAQAARVAADHEAAMARWRADVAACNGGDKSRCAPTP